ncbi:hypothetical protein ACMFMG_008556 [Clarireedia jacksonii]
MFPKSPTGSERTTTPQFACRRSLVKLHVAIFLSSHNENKVKFLCNFTSEHNTALHTRTVSQFFKPNPNSKVEPANSNLSFCPRASYTPYLLRDDDKDVLSAERGVDFTGMDNMALAPCATQHLLYFAFFS